MSRVFRKIVCPNIRSRLHPSSLFSFSFRIPAFFSCLYRCFMFRYLLVPHSFVATYLSLAQTSQGCCSSLCYASARAEGRDRSALRHALAVKLGCRLQLHITHFLFYIGCFFSVASLSSWAYVAFSRDMVNASLLCGIFDIRFLKNALCSVAVSHPGTLPRPIPGNTGACRFIVPTNLQVDAVNEDIRIFPRERLVALLFCFAIHLLVQAADCQGADPRTPQEFLV